MLDPGAGTGKLTATLVALGAEVIAVESDPAMPAELCRLLPAVRALPGSAEAIPLPDASVDVVPAGNAVHWFDTAVAGPEIARVLAPSGVSWPASRTSSTTGASGSPGSRGSAGARPSARVIRHQPAHRDGRRTPPKDRRGRPHESHARPPARGDRPRRASRRGAGRSGRTRWAPTRRAGPAVAAMPARQPPPRATAGPRRRVEQILPGSQTVRLLTPASPAGRPLHERERGEGPLDGFSREPPQGRPVDGHRLEQPT
ncbi:class I SAM-dependent methyltransferase [Streptomyces carpinensis]|nr:class I SAM-dependent methyltransferase [Streptomyces carpinensis]